MKSAIILLVLGVVALVNQNSAAPYGYTPPITPVAKGPIISPPADPTTVDTAPVELPHTPIEPSTCGCGTNCGCDANGPSKSCTCEGVCHCGEHKPKPSPKPSPKPCGCEHVCGCEANAPTKDCNCEKPCGCGQKTNQQKNNSAFNQILANLQALLASLRS